MERIELEFIVNTYDVLTSGDNHEGDATLIHIIHLKEGNENDKSLHLAFSEEFKVGHVVTTTEKQFACEFPLINYLPTLEALKALKGVEIEVIASKNEQGLADYQFKGVIT